MYVQVTISVKFLLDEELSSLLTEEGDIPCDEEGEDFFDILYLRYTPMITEGPHGPLTFVSSSEGQEIEDERIREFEGKKYLLLNLQFQFDISPDSIFENEETVKENLCYIYDIANTLVQNNGITDIESVPSHITYFDEDNNPRIVSFEDPRMNESVWEE